MFKVKLIFSFFCLLFLNIFLTLLSPVNALMIPDVFPVNEQAILGQNHYYSVFFRGNGEAVVNLKAQFTNTFSSPVSSVTYYFPHNISPDSVTVFQVYPGKINPCYSPYSNMRYLPADLEPESVKKIPSASATPAIESKSDESQQPSRIVPCADGQFYSGMNNNQYVKAEHQLNNSKLVIDLPNPVTVNSEVKFFLTFRTHDYVRRNIFGSLNYNFETLKSDQLIDNLQVGIEAEQDYVLKEAKGQVNYQRKTSAVDLPTSLSVESGMYRQELDNYYNRIGQGSIYKYASHLAVNESFKVKGEYADSVWKLYALQAGFGLVVVLAILILAVLLIKKIFRIYKSSFSHPNPAKTPAHSALAITQNSLLLAVGSSLAGATMAVCYSIFLYFFMNTLMPLLSTSFDLEKIFVLLMFVLSFGIYSAVIFVPALLLASRKSVTVGIITFVFTIIWLVFYLFLVFLFSVVLFTRDNIYPPDPYQIIGTENGRSIQPQEAL